MSFVVVLLVIAAYFIYHLFCFALVLSKYIPKILSKIASGSMAQMAKAFGVTIVVYVTRDLNNNDPIYS